MFSDVKKKILKYLVAFRYNEKIKTPTLQAHLLEQTIDAKENTRENTDEQVLQAKELEEALETNIKELEENGYTIIHNVYNTEEIEEYKKEFFNWYKNTKNVEELHQIIHGNGILVRATAVR